MSATASNGEVDGFDPLANKPKRSAKHKDSKDKGKKIASPNQFQQLQQKQVMNALIDASKNEQKYRADLAAAIAEHGEKHINVCRQATRLADLCYHTGRFVEAEPLLRQALSIAEVDEECGPQHPETAKLVNNLGNVLRKQGKQEEARSMHERAVNIAQAVFGRCHPNTDTARSNLVELLDEMNEGHKALAILEQAVIDEQEQPDSNTKQQRLAGALRGLAAVQIKQGKMKEAETSLTRSLALFQEALGNNHPATGSTMAAIANLLRTEGREDEAFPHYTKLLEITEAALGPKHPQCGIALHSLAQVNLALGKRALGMLALAEAGTHQAEAMKCIERAVSIMRHVHGGVHNLLADFLDTMATCAIAVGNDAQASEASKEASSVREKTKEMMLAQKEAAASIDLKKMQHNMKAEMQSKAAGTQPSAGAYDEPLLNPTQERLRKKLAAKSSAGK